MLDVEEAYKKLMQTIKKEDIKNFLIEIYSDGFYKGLEKGYEDGLEDISVEKLR